MQPVSFCQIQVTAHKCVQPFYCLILYEWGRVSPSCGYAFTAVVLKSAVFPHCSQRTLFRL